MLAALTIAASAAAALIDAPNVELGSRRVRISDVARPIHLSRASWNRLAPLVIATVPDRGAAITVSRKAVAQLVVRRAPSLRLAAGAGVDPIRFEVRRPSSNIAVLGCRTLATAHDAGELVAATDLRPASCVEAARADLRFDRRTRRLTAASALPAGAYLGRVAPGEDAPVKSGDIMRLISRVGSVAVERPVTALQLGRLGKRVFVRDPDGQVFAARFDTGEIGR